MPLSPPVDRDLLHNRDITLRGYQRADGLFDIEAQITDTKTYAFSNFDRGEITPGVPLHQMLARMTIDSDMTIVRFEAVTEYGPFSICPTGAESFATLAGLKVGRGFLKAANERVGGVHGCTHLRELLGQMGTVAFQTMYANRHKRQTAPNAIESSEKPMLIGTCYGYAPDSPVVARQYPRFYTGSLTTETSFKTE